MHPVVVASVCKSYLGRPSLLGCDFCDNPGVPLSSRNNWMQKSIPTACRCRMDVSRPISTAPPHCSRPFLRLPSSIETTWIAHPCGISNQPCRLPVLAPFDFHKPHIPPPSTPHLPS